MSNFRSAAEEFVTEFLDYVQEHDILDHFNRRTQKMERSPGVDKLISRAKAVFPERKPEGVSAALMRELSDEQREAAIRASSEVIDTREQFSRRIAHNGGVRRLLREVLAGDEKARVEAEQFFLAEDGAKEFK